MNSNCVTEAQLQAFLDHELDDQAGETIAQHTAQCAGCAAALAAAEAEIAQLSFALDLEVDVPVPSAKLRERIESAIRVKPVRAGLITQLMAGFGWRFSGAQWFRLATVGACALVTVGAIALLLHQWSQANSVQSETASQWLQIEQIAIPTLPQGTESVKPRDKARNLRSVSQRGPTGRRSAEEQLAGERQYLERIAKAQQVLQAQGDLELRPMLRADYERNLAILDHAIDSSRTVALRHPHDLNSTRFLYSSYQSKLELMETVSNQLQLYAGLR